MKHKGNTRIVFMYRDGNNYKFTSEHILYGIFSNLQKKKLQEMFEEAESLLIPNQISTEFSNLCPLKPGQEYSTDNEYEWDEESDHPYHSITLIESTSDSPTVEINSEVFYKKAISGTFNEF